MKCPRDTNGDGDCGRPLCPYCGKDSAPHMHRLMLTLIGKVASDCWDEKTIVEHIEDMDLDIWVAGALRRRIAEHFGMDPGQGSPHVFIEDTHRVMGTNHWNLLDDLRDLACEMDPKADERHYGKARNLPSPPTFSNLTI